jgi:hypothetical protein
MIQKPDELEVLTARKQLVDRRILAGETYQRSHLFCFADHVVSADPRSAAIGLEQGGQDAHERRLTGTVRPEQGHD